MYSIDEIMKMLDCNNPIEEQELGIELGRQIKSINVFLKPRYPGPGKSLWLNSAKILAERSDEELEYQLDDLLNWLHNLNDPGAVEILERLQKFEKCDRLSFSLICAVKDSFSLDDREYIENLSKLVVNEKLKAMLPQTTLYTLTSKFDIVKFRAEQ